MQKKIILLASLLKFTTHIFNTLKTHTKMTKKHLINPYIELHKSSSTTATDRFNACRRLSKLDSASVHAMTFSSIALIIISIISIGKFENIKIPENLNDIVTLVQTCLPILLLAISINISNANYGAKAQRMHDSAKQLNDFSKKIYPFSMLDEWEEMKYEEHRIEYAVIIDKSENHENVDHQSTKRNKEINTIKKNQKGICGYYHLQIADILLKNGKTIYFYYAAIFFSLLWVIFIILKSYK